MGVKESGKTGGGGGERESMCVRMREGGETEKQINRTKGRREKQSKKMEKEEKK